MTLVRVGVALMMMLLCSIRPNQPCIQGDKPQGDPQDHRPSQLRVFELETTIECDPVA